MVNTGNYQVVACNKSITFRSEAVVIIGNLPTAWVEAKEADEDALKHFELHSQVYFHMARMAPDARNACALRRSQNVNPCTSPRADTPVARIPPIVHHLFHGINPDAPQLPHHGGLPTPGSTFECSATQWP